MAVTRLIALSEAVIDIAKGEDLKTSLKRLVENAVALSDATYGALGALGADGSLEEFTYVGMSEETADEIASFPEGKGLLGHLLTHPVPLRVNPIRSHPASSGFPAGHPLMISFLGVPIRIRDEIYGSLYLTEKRGGEDFTEEDEQLVSALASAAGVAIDNARGLEAQHRVIVLAERERIARDLHDLVIQRLFATGLSLQAITKDPECSEKDLVRLREVIDNLDATVQQIRNSVFALQDQNGPHGLRSRIQTEIDSLRTSSAINMTCEFNGPIDTVIDGELAENVFAVLRELLTNAIKHSKAHLVEVQISALKTRCEVRIVDDGIGIADNVNRSGLLNLSKRAEDFGGTFEIYIRPSGGTRAIWTGKL
ncbi:MAG: GAF domain-containing protein [Candidatus Nanopelagicaceae bacterium]|jgi:signal transduction histidine kinase